MKLLFVVCGVALGLFATSPSVWAGHRKPAEAAGGSKSIEFDEKVVEGMNMRDLSSAEHVGENRRKKGDRLIREKADFRDELDQSLKELKWVR